ncbi:DUF2335 domain-containing protein [Flavihumibacter sp. CACIAM 22H1]|uniref:DUF2335 domain-containing protein n=1 Tax=Flavihumibacter sp. CACIAM 22H1 TaxID=1812911 RepID=UPI0007A8B678|nr:DUF2335 domain-containing protein [Flavihumibacter sp. CACIAM 22H1]KYP14370.1 MAG: hypothetical protein A1D16_11635 [Flavihumibacter sp. CACIAM 22H1]
MSRSNHNKKKVVVRPDQTVEGTSFEGIIPDPETLSQLEALAPGCTKKWMELAESEIKSRQKNEDRITWTFKNSTILGQVLAFLSSTMIFAVGCYALYLGHPTAAATIITGSAASVIAAYYFRRQNQNKD